MIEKMILATAITFALNLFIGISSHTIAPKADLNPAPDALFQTASTQGLPLTGTIGQ